MSAHRYEMKVFTGRGQQRSPFFMMVGGRLTPVLQFQRVFSCPSKNSKGYPFLKTCWGQTKNNTYTYTVEIKDLPLIFPAFQEIHADLLEIYDDSALVNVSPLVSCLH